MIPVRLRVENFLSYRHPDPIEFTGLDVVCLTGANGTGKSSLLDALTWALFGAARGCEGGQNQERLVHDGQDRATVELDFELGGDVYRVVRSRARSGKGELQFLIRADESWTSLAGETLRETEACIAQRIRMDYRTFVASAFFLQGRADDFLTRMRPEERKDVFARLLDLGTYERLEDAARANGREAESRRKELVARVESLAAEVADRELVQRQLTEAHTSVAAAEARLKGASDELEADRAELQRLERDVAMAERERTAIRDLAARIQTCARTLIARDEELRLLDELLGRAPEVDAALAEAERVRISDDALRETAARCSELDTRRAELAGEIEAERKGIEARREHRRARLDEIGRTLDALVAEARALEQAEALLAESEAVTAELERVRSELAALLAEDAGLDERIKSIDAGDAERNERLDLLALGAGRCPVCEGELDDVHRREIVRKLREERRGLASERKAFESRRAEVRKEGRRLREEERRLLRVLADREKLAADVAAMRARAGRRAELTTERTRLLGEDGGDEELLRSKAFASEQRVALAAVEHELQASPYDAEAHVRVRERLAELSGFLELRGRIGDAASRRERLVRERDELASQAAEDERSLAERRRALDVLAEAERAMPDLRDRVELAAEAVRETQGAMTAATADRARLAERVANVERAASELAAARDAERATGVDHRRYMRLAQAFGRGGIPDLVIENALPELHAEANDVLGRLTDAEMSVQFAMRRETKSGKPKDTFDVLVEHDGGVREFQMFSGGEAFRIAFAVRMALSKLLVRRAGARLETLVIDEGFGTQDAEGRERLVEAINLARTEFRKVLVITHLDELKDAFPVQIQVIKDAQRGSMVRVVDAWRG